MKTSSLKTKILFPVVLLGAALNTACSVETMGSDEVSPAAVYQNYSVNYYADSNTTEYYAQFRAGGFTGTTLSLSSPSQVTTNGKKMSGKWMLGTYYGASVSGFQPEARFEWTDNAQKVYVNSVNLKPIGVRLAAATVSARQPYVVELNVEGLSSDENVEVSLQQESLGQNEPSRHASAIYSNQRATFSPAELMKLREGTATLLVRRGTSRSLPNATKEGGSISGYYHAPKQGVTIMDVNGQMSLARQ
ncbi:MAG: hypothetical protein AB7N80_12850 [Bdellovibrionales bacterium]